MNNVKKRDGERGAPCAQIVQACYLFYLYLFLPSPA